MVTNVFDIQTTLKHRTVSRAVARILQIPRSHVLALLGGLINELSLKHFSNNHMWLITFIYPVCNYVYAYMFKCDSSVCLWPDWVSSSMDICRLKSCGETWAWRMMWLHNAVQHFQCIHVTTSNLSDTISFQWTHTAGMPVLIVPLMRSQLSIDQNHFVSIISQLQCPKSAIKVTF